jgi:hypothetical protein
MKKFVLLIAMAFMMAPMINASVEVEEDQGPSCGTMFTICDAAAPDSFDDFYTCMNRNGCG